MDSAPGIIASFKYAIKEMGFEMPSDEDLEAMVGPALHIALPTIFGENIPLEETISHYRSYYEEEGIFLAEPYDGLAEMFDELHRIEANIYVATSKPKVFADRITSHFGLDRYINGLFGAELSGERSDKTELLAHALDETGALPSEALMIGDRHYDINGARNCDIASIGALWGYGGLEELRQAEADALSSGPEEVPELACDLLGVELS